MRHTVGILVATTTLLLAAGCGSDSGTTADEPSSSPSGASGWKFVAILSQTAAGGEITGQAIDLGTPSGIDELVDGLIRGGFDQQVRAGVAATDVPDGQRLVGAIVNVGCDTPTGVTVTSESGGVTLEPTFTGKPMNECFAAVTSIALVLVAA